MKKPESSKIEPVSRLIKIGIVIAAILLLIKLIN